MFIDLIIIIFLIFGAILGAKRGFTKELVTLVGFIAVLVISFLLKGYVVELFYDLFPFFEFDGLTALNILLYESISMLILVIFLSAILKLILRATSAFEKFLNFTIVLGIPSKILGAILGIIEHIGLAFIVLYVASINYNVAADSKVANFILTETPLLSNVCDKTIETVKEINELKEKSEEINSNNATLNRDILNLMIEKKVISEEKVADLINKGKLEL